MRIIVQVAASCSKLLHPGEEFAMPSDSYQCIKTWIVMTEIHIRRLFHFTFLFPRPITSAGCCRALQQPAKMYVQPRMKCCSKLLQIGSITARRNDSRKKRFCTFEENHCTFDRGFVKAIGGSKLRGIFDCYFYVLHALVVEVFHLPVLLRNSKTILWL